MSNVNVKIEAQEGELVIREGKAPAIHDPVKLSIKGDIHSLNNFLAIRKNQESVNSYQEVDPGAAIVQVFKSQDKIVFNSHPFNPFSTEVVSRLEYDEQFTKFGINQQKFYSKTDLLKLIKFSRLQFEKADEHNSLLIALQKVESSVSINGSDSADDRGNKTKAFEKTVKTNIPASFVLKVPIFSGFEAKTFRVEICLDVTDSSIRFWLESVELSELIEIEKEKAFSEALKECEGLVVVYC